MSVDEKYEGLGSRVRFDLAAWEGQQRLETPAGWGNWVEVAWDYSVRDEPRLADFEHLPTQAMPCPAGFAYPKTEGGDSGLTEKLNDVFLGLERKSGS